MYVGFCFLLNKAEQSLGSIALPTVNRKRAESDRGMGGYRGRHRPWKAPPVPGWLRTTLEPLVQDNPHPWEVMTSPLRLRRLSAWQ